MKNITILGSTGSIGLNSLKVIESNPDEYRVMALGAGRNIDLLAKQIERYHPVIVALSEEHDAIRLKERIKGHTETEVLHGQEGFSLLASLDEIDMVISAITGAAGLVPTYEAIKARKYVALANKETMVMAGPIIMELAEKLNVSILPIDSEHSAILQSLQGHNKEDLKRIILTASGGPFREASSEQLKATTPEEALQHPNWDMGKKISIDSATLMNKGLEVIEAKWLFDLDIGQISIVIHPESIIHSMVEYNDGSVIAQMGVPDMITPISYALSFPRHKRTILDPLELHKAGPLHFYEPDIKRFKCLSLALNAAESGGSAPTVLNGANEIAVDAFLNSKIGFLEIPEIIEKTINTHTPVTINSIDEVLAIDKWARETAEKEIIRSRA